MTISEILEKAKSGTKFVDADMTPELQAQARDYIKNYAGTFSFMLDLQSSTRKLSVGMLRGALNVLLAETRRQLPNDAPEALDADALFAFFDRAQVRWPKVKLLTADDTAITIKFSSKNDAISIVSSDEFVWNEKFGRSMPRWYGNIARDGSIKASQRWSVVADVLAALASDPASTIAAYGFATGNCSVCGLALTDARSLAVGYGPVCAKHWHLPWGASASAAA